MASGIKRAVFIYLCFTLLFAVSGSLSGIFGQILYYISYILPFALGFRLANQLRQKREQEKGVSENLPNLFKLTKKCVKRTAPLVFPTVAFIFSLSYLTAIIMSLFDFYPSQVENTGLFDMLVRHALLPAVLEELLFRLLPMLLILPYSKRGCIAVSSICFAVCHFDIFKLPYALAAGVIFILMDIAYDSVLPSITVHFVNNAASVVWIVLAQGVYKNLFVIILYTLAFLSFIPIIINRKNYKSEYLKTVEGSTGAYFTTELIVFVVFGFLISLGSLFAV